MEGRSRPIRLSILRFLSEAGRAVDNGRYIGAWRTRPPVMPLTRRGSPS